MGLVGPNDVHALQERVAAYQVQLQLTVEALGKAGRALPQDGSTYSDAAWNDLVKRCLAFEGESSDTRNPFAYLFAGAAYDRGRQLIGELDRWRDQLATQAAASSTSVPVPPPIDVPGSDIGLAGGLGFALAALVAILALRELR